MEYLIGLSADRGVLLFDTHQEEDSEMLSAAEAIEKQ